MVLVSSDSPRDFDLRRSVSRRLYEEAFRAFAKEQYDYAIEILMKSISESSVLENTQQLTVFDALVLVGRCCRWMNDFKQLDMVCEILSTSDRWSDDNFDKTILTAHHSDNVAKEFSELVPDVVAIECLTKQDFVAREKLLYRGLGQLRIGKFRQALTDLEVCFLFSALSIDFRLQAECANCLGLYYMGIGNIRHATEWFKKSSQTGEIVQSDRRIGLSTLNLGVCMYKLGDYTKAKEYVTISISRLEAGKDELNLYRAYLAYASVLRLTRQFTQAREVLNKAYASICNRRFRREECLALELFGDILRDEECYPEALQFYQSARIIAKDIAPNGDLIGGLSRREGECLLRQGLFGEGLESLVKALFHVRRIGDRFEEGVIQRCLAEGFLGANDHAKALEYINNAISMLEETDARHESAIARLVAGDILLRCSGATSDEQPRDLLDQAWDHSIVAQSIVLNLEMDFWTDAVKQLQSRIVKRRQEEHRFQAGALLVGSVECGTKNGSPPLTHIVVAESRAMKEVLQAAAAYAPYDDTILLTGETGTGKELIAELIHQQSNRNNRRMVTVNITALAPTMFERELFGHVRGSYSGAVTDGIGFADAANGSTLFLDEIGELPLEMQVKLLRILQNGSYHRLGDTAEKMSDLRVIVATNRDLKKAVSTGLFREDLFYRLAGLEIYIPALRERPEDILPLLEHYLSVRERRAVTVEQYFNEGSRRLLTRYGWPGNVREVIHTARRACFAKMLHGHVEIELGNHEESILLTGPEPLVSSTACKVSNRRSLSRAHLLLALEECGGNRTEAARMLGISRSSIYRRLEKLVLD